MSEEAIRKLEERITEIEDKIERLLHLSDYDRHPFTYLTVEMKLTRAQVKALFELMDEARKSLSTQLPMNHTDFERRVYGIVPEQSGNYHFAEGIVATLNKTDQYTDVYKEMKRDGMNI